MELVGRIMALKMSTTESLKLRTMSCYTPKRNSVYNGIKIANHLTLK